MFTKPVRLVFSYIISLSRTNRRHRGHRKQKSKFCLSHTELLSFLAEAYKNSLLKRFWSTFFSLSHYFQMTVRDSVTNYVVFRLLYSTIYGHHHLPNRYNENSRKDKKYFVWNIFDEGHHIIPIENACTPIKSENIPNICRPAAKKVENIKTGLIKTWFVILFLIWLWSQNRLLREAQITVTIWLNHTKVMKSFTSTFKTTFWWAQSRL